MAAKVLCGEEMAKFMEVEWKKNTGQWFEPLPCHIWQLRSGVRVELELSAASRHWETDKPMMKGEITTVVNDIFYIGGHMLQLHDVDMMRIVSYEVQE